MSRGDARPVHNRYCHMCNVRLSRYNTDNFCWPCQEARRASIAHPRTGVASSPSSVSKPRTLPYQSGFTLQSILHTVRRTKPLGNSSIGQVLITFRNTHRITQRELAALLGFDQSYISKLENGQSLRDIVALKDIADRLGIPPHWLGLTLEDYATKYSAEMLMLAPSVIRLARTARETGRSDDAVNELWPLLLRLEAQVAQDMGNAPLQLTLAAGQATLGVILGDLLAEEDLFMSVYFFKKAVAIAEAFGDNRFKAEVYRGCGNELRKHRQSTEAIEYLERALSIAPDSVTKGMAATLMARTYGEIGDRRNFDDVIESVLHFLDRASDFTPTFNPVTIREVHLRGLISVGPISKIPSLLESSSIGKVNVYVAPQWSIISQLTMAEAMFRTRKLDEGLSRIQTALFGAELYKLPHQVQRALRSLKLVETDKQAHPIVKEAQVLLERLSHPAAKLLYQTGE